MPASRVPSRLDGVDRVRGDLRAPERIPSARQIDKHTEFVFHPLCIRQLLVEAAAKIHLSDGNNHLSEPDLEVIYMRGDANGAAHVIKPEDQAAAVLASVSMQPQRHASLARIFTFVHGRPIMRLHRGQIQNRTTPSRYLPPGELTVKWSQPATSSASSTATMGGGGPSSSLVEVRGTPDAAIQ